MSTSKANFQSLLTQRKIDFPYKSYFHTDPTVFWNNLLKHEPKLVKGEYELACPGADKRFPFTFRGAKHYIPYEDTYERIDLLTDLFTEEQRVKANVKGNISPYEYFSTNAGRIIARLRTLGKQATPYNLREAVYEKTREATQFKITLAYTIYKLFSARRTLDISAGWGDRLLAAIASGIEYVGYDPNGNLEKGHGEIIKTFGNKDKHIVHYEPFETSEVEGTFDLIFTSPPFFDLESYTNTEGQSIVSYPKYENWLSNFLLASLTKSWNALEVGGHLVLHLTDVGNLGITNSVNKHLETLEGAKYCGVIGAQGAYRTFPIWVWRKESSASTDAVLQKKESITK